MCAVAFLVAYGALAGRLAVVSFSGFERTSRPALAETRAPVRRGDIFDRHGVLLATDLPVVALEIDGAEVWDAAESTERLAGLFPDIDRAALAARLEQGRHVEVKSDLTPAQREAAFALGLPGVRFTERVRRFYPQGRLAAHVVGHGAPGRGGVMGLERVLDAQTDGAAIISSIDLRVQRALEEELVNARRRHRAEAAFGIIIDAQTGEVLALANAPDFDPNAPGAAPADWRRNRAIYDRYELGSAFKAFTAAAALEAGTADETSTYDARGVYRIADRVIRDFHGKNRVLSFSEVIQYSSNIGMARMAGELGPERQRAAFARLGLLESLPIELPERRAPESPRRWGPVENATVSFGHGIAVTPLHLAAAYAAIVNGGTFYTPTFLRAEDARQGTLAFSERTSATMRRVLRRVITDGTARRADAPGYFPIGKTATANKPARGGYDGASRIATFVGAFPGYAPRYVALISLDNPQPDPGAPDSAAAGWTAAPAFARLVERAAPLLGVSPVSEATALAAFYRGFPSATADLRAAGGGAP